MEARLGADLRAVRLHIGPEPAAVGAAAFAWGEHIYFSPDAVAADIRCGHRILAHELTHVLQQRAGRVVNPFGSGVAVIDDPALEREADAAAEGGFSHDRFCEPVRSPAARQTIQCITYRNMRRMGASYQGEENSQSPHRNATNPTIQTKEAELKLLITQYNQKQIECQKRSRRLGAIRHRTQVGEIKRQMENLHAQITKAKKFFELQGMKLNADGSVNWAASQKVVQYDHGLARQGLTKLVGRGGKLFWESTGTAASTESMVTFFSGVGYAIYVMSHEGNIHMRSHSIGEHHHSTLLRGADVSGAGEIQITADGTLLWISNKTGHYRAEVIHLSQVIHQLGKMGVPSSYKVSAFSFDATGNLITENCQASAFVQKTDEMHDYELIRLLDYCMSFFHPAIAQKLQWVWSNQPEPGFYSFVTGEKIGHRVARKRLKELGIQHNGYYVGDGGQLRNVPNGPANVMPGPLNNTAIGNRYEYTTLVGPAGRYEYTPVNPAGPDQYSSVLGPGPDQYSSVIGPANPMQDVPL